MSKLNAEKYSLLTNNVQKWDNVLKVCPRMQRSRVKVKHTLVSLSRYLYETTTSYLLLALVAGKLKQETPIVYIVMELSCANCQDAKCLSQSCIKSNTYSDSGIMYYGKIILNWLYGIDVYTILPFRAIFKFQFWRSQVTLPSFKIINSTSAKLFFCTKIPWDEELIFS